MLDKLSALNLATLSEQQFLDCLRAYSLVFARMGKRPSDAARMAPLAEFFPSQSQSINQELCRLLVYLEMPAVITPALTLMQSDQHQESQLHYAFVLRHLKQGWTLQQRRIYFGWLRKVYKQYEGGQSFQGFVNRILADAVKTLSDEERDAVADIIRGREVVEQLADAPPPRKFVQNWQLADFRENTEGSSRSRSFAKGLAAYRAGQCHKCHRMRGNGGVSGPDLTGVGSRFDTQYLLEAIIDPSRVIPEQYQRWHIATHDGEILIGKIVSETNEELKLRTGPFAADTVTVAMVDVAVRKVAPISEMPTGLVNALTKDEILDLIAYLRAGGDPDDPAFERTDSAK